VSKESATDLIANLPRSLHLVHEYQGGQGRTFCVRSKDGVPLTLKVLPHGEEATEVKVAASIDHPSIPSVHEIGRLPDGRVYVLRDHIDGDVLESLPRTVETLRPILQQLLEVIAFVHHRGVLHLDLKPSNLVVDSSGQLHLLDFGLAIRAGSLSQGGTPFFAAPEVLFGAVPDRRSDLFSIGAMVAHALIPTEQLSIPEFVRNFPARDFFAACQFDREQLPHPFGTFIDNCVTRRPGRRFPDADTALEALCGGGTGRPSAAMLAPDPAQLFANELDGLADTKSDIRIEGGDSNDRRAIAMQLAVTLPAVDGMSEVDNALVLHRDGGGKATAIELPQLDAARLLPHLKATLGLEGAALTTATDWLLQRSQSSSGITKLLEELVAAGQLLPAGTRWSWPNARSGRLANDDAIEAADSEGSIDEQIRAATARGMTERARALWLASPEEKEPTARTALIEGLLDAGEPSRALPLCMDLPILRAQALVDTGQYALAARELAQLGPPETSRHRRVAALLAMVGGDRKRARAMLEEGPGDLRDRLMLAALLEQSGQLDASEHLLQRCLQELDGEREPYAVASVHTTYGHLERQRKNLDAARQHFETAEQLAQRIAHVRHAASSQLNLGVVAKDAGEHSEAAARFREANALYEHVGDIGRAAIAKANLGIAALARDDIETARTTLTEAAARLQELGDTATAKLAHLMLARAHARAGDKAAAEVAIATVGEPDTERLRQELAIVKEELAAPDDSGHDDDMPGGSETRPSRELFRTFLAVNRKLAQAVELDEAMGSLLDAAVTLTGGRNGYLLVMSDGGIQREFESGQGASQAQAFSRSLANQAVHEQRTLTGADVLANEELQAMQSVKNLRVRSAVCSPFHSAGGTKGAIYVEHPGRAGVFSEQDKEALEVLADQAAIAVDRMLREEAMRRELTTSKRDLVVATRSSRRNRAQLLGDSAPMRALRTEIDKLANLDLAILIQGETGTGKELVARALHDRGNRKKGPFVAENCSALPAELMERELFGHVEGAFTGADRERPGLLELANGGTLFLDEVGDMPAALQVKLLRALQEQTIRRVGGSEEIQLDIRMVSATHRNLREMVKSDEFREDLFFRLAAVEVRVPTLRERKGDIELLATHFITRNSQHGAKPPELSATAKAALNSYSWPGNVRELEHVIARAILLCEDGESIDLQLPADPASGAPEADGIPPTPELITLKEAEKRAIKTAIALHGGDKTKAAKALGVSRTALYDKIKRHGLTD